MFYDKFCELCTAKNLSPSRVALEIGINKGTVSVWKNKGSTPSAENLKIIAKYFGVTVDYLLGNEKKENPTTNQSDEVSRLLQDPTMKLIYDKLLKLNDEQIDEVTKYVDYLRSKQENQ